MFFLCIHTKLMTANESNRKTVGFLWLTNINYCVIINNNLIIHIHHFTEIDYSFKCKNVSTNILFSPHAHSWLEHITSRQGFANSLAAKIQLKNFNAGNKAQIGSINSVYPYGWNSTQLLSFVITGGAEKSRWTR